MTDHAKASADWTEPERWVWERIAAGEPADFNARDRERSPELKDLDPRKEDGWAENRRLRAKFLQTILTQTDFVDVTPYSGIRILGAIVNDGPLNLEHARLQRLFWLESSRILIDVKCRNVRVDGEFSLENSFVAGDVKLARANILESLCLGRGTFHGEVDLVSASIGSVLDMTGATFGGKVNLNSAKVGGGALLSAHKTLNDEPAPATFKGDVDLVGISIGSVLDMSGSTFEGKVDLNSAKVAGSAFLRAVTTFKDEVDLGGASIGSVLDMSGSTFGGKVNLNSAKVGDSAFLSAHKASNGKVTSAIFKGAVNLEVATIGSGLDMGGSTFEGEIALAGVSIGSGLLLRGSTFHSNINLAFARIGPILDFSNATMSGRVELAGCQVLGELQLGSSGPTRAHWKSDDAKLSLRNAHVGTLQDWWQDSSHNSWPRILELEGFTFDRLGGLYGKDHKEADMMGRPSEVYIEWLGRDGGSSPQPYEHLAGLFRRAGEPGKANDILYEARKRRRRLAWSTVDHRGHSKGREVIKWFGLWLLGATIGYGLGNRYFRVLWWVAGLTLLGTVLLIVAGQQSPERWPWPSMFFASLDQLLPIITLNKAHDALIFGDPSANPPVKPQPLWIQYYFYVHMILGWALGSFIVAGLAGLTQKN